MRNKVYKELIEPFMGYSCFKEMKSRISYLTLQNYLEIQQKGGYKEVKTYKYMGFRFRTALTKDEEEIFFMIDKNNRCFILKIDLEYPGLAILEGFGNEPKCSVPKLPKDGGGTIMMYFLLNYVKRFLPDVERIELTDNSRIKCGKEDVYLCELYTLTTGITWYGKFGFMPSGKESKKKYRNNYKIMNKIKTSDVWLDLGKIFEKYGIKKNDGLLKNDLKKMFKINCKYFYKINKYLYFNTKLIGLYGKNYILKMDNYNPVTR